jgi:hypothetical protein
MSQKIFLSYRKSDSPEAAFLIAAYLKDVYGTRNVFIDENLRGGQNFARELEKKLDECRVLLAIIGPHWLSAADEKGNKRLDDPDDWVRREIRCALDRGVDVIPILLNGTKVPPKSILPNDIVGLVDHQAINVRTNDQTFKADMNILRQAIGTVGSNRFWFALIAASILVLTAAWAVSHDSNLLNISFNTVQSGVRADKKYVPESDTKSNARNSNKEKANSPVDETSRGNNNNVTHGDSSPIISNIQGNVDVKVSR